MINDENERYPLWLGTEKLKQMKIILLNTRIAFLMDDASEISCINV